MIFLNSASSAAALVFCLPFSGPGMKPGVYTPRENRERPESGKYFKIFEKSTIFSEHRVYYKIKEIFDRLTASISLLLLLSPVKRSVSILIGNYFSD